ncbi:hypothetical protein GUJ93_ZPchr0002g23777 [Zizania palustris]|uniref:CSD domain-containing protein n=1 Tax=Zizania palustris TaxID=103762 RepID=A0A8J5VRQ5_ZIZPA|nr:hypothetical protein GUJ93_ZPchr0002g23777 [Zizania palustris]
MAEAARHRGTVKWFNDTKGFGFISPEDGSEDLFVHQSSIKADGFRSLAEGEQVEFAVSESEDGRTKAVDVTGPDGSFVKVMSFVTGNEMTVLSLPNVEHLSRWDPKEKRRGDRRRQQQWLCDASCCVSETCADSSREVAFLTVSSAQLSPAFVAKILLTL